MMTKQFEGEPTIELTIVHADPKYSALKLILANFAANRVGAMPVLYRIA